MSEPALDFDFDFGKATRAELLSQAARGVGAMQRELGPGDAPAATTDDPAARLIGDLNREIAEFGAFPEVAALQADDFQTSGLKVPERFTELAKSHRFYWVRLPLTLKPLDNLPFTRLQCAVEFNPGDARADLRPIAQMVLPDRKFQTLLQAHTSLTLSIDENFEFEAKGAADADGVKVAGGVGAKAGAGAGFTAGPFNYTVNKAKINHSGTGSAKVFWSLEGAEFFEAQEPVLVVVLRVPNGVTQVQVAAALQASHSFQPLAANVGAVLGLIGERIANFFRKGAPIRATKVWDLSPRL